MAPIQAQHLQVDTMALTIGCTHSSFQSVDATVQTCLVYSQTWLSYGLVDAHLA